MVMLYPLAAVLTLKLIAPPLLTDMSVANPWMLGSPEPLMSHVFCGVPGFWFSQTMAFPRHAACTDAIRGLKPANPTSATRQASTPPRTPNTAARRRFRHLFPTHQWT